MKLFQRLLVAPAALGLLAPMTAIANELKSLTYLTTLLGMKLEEHILIIRPLLILYLVEKI